MNRNHVMQDRPSVCVVIGASTGGPSTLVEVLRQMPDIQYACVLILQHLDDKLSHNLAAWLSEKTGLDVMQPKGSYQPKQGEVVLLTGSHWAMNAVQQVEACQYQGDCIKIINHNKTL